MGGTDCAQPMIYAKKKLLEVDVFIVYTDCETWAGIYYNYTTHRHTPSPHPSSKRCTNKRSLFPFRWKALTTNF